MAARLKSHNSIEACQAQHAERLCQAVDTLGIYEVIQCVKRTDEVELRSKS